MLVTASSCRLPNSDPNTPALDGALSVDLAPSSRAASIYSSTTANEEFFCSYELNRDYETQLVDAGLTVSGRGTEGEPRIIELTDHPYYLATLFLPQLSSTPDHPHPLITAFVAAVSRHDVA